MNAPPTDERGSEGEEEVGGGGLELADAAENYCALMLEVREAAAARGLTFREVMMAMAQGVLAAMGTSQGETTMQRAIQSAGDGLKRMKWDGRPFAAESSVRSYRRQFARGELRDRIIAVLREAGTPISARQVHESLAAAGLAVSCQHVTVALCNNVGSAFKRVVVEESPNRRVLWMLKGDSP